MIFSNHQFKFKTRIWTTSVKGWLIIHHAGLVDFLYENGIFLGEMFDKKKILLYRNNNRLYEISKSDIASFLDQAISQMDFHIGDGHTRRDLRNALIRGSKIYIDQSHIDWLPTKEIQLHRDTKDESFFYFQNGVVRVTGDKISLLSYRSLNAPVWNDSILKVDISPKLNDKHKSVFEQFVFNICEAKESRFESMKSIIGYLLHRYKEPSNAKAIFFMDEKIGDVDDANGGSGKSLLGKAIGFLRNVEMIAGKQFKMHQKFSLQRVNVHTDLIFVNDTRYDDNLESYYNLITDDLVIEQKYRKEFVIPFEYSPKLFCSTNYIIQGPIGNSSERRKVEIELADYYNKEHTPLDDFGHALFEDWDLNEWSRFYQFMFRCVQLYLKNGIIEPPAINIKYRKMMAECTPELVEFVQEMIEAGQTKIHVKDSYDEFRKANPARRWNRSFFIRKLKALFHYKDIQYQETANRAYFELLDQPDSKEKVVAPTENEFQSIGTVKHNYHLVDSEKQRKELIDQLSRCEHFCFDTETTGLQIHSLDIVGLAICMTASEAYYIPMPDDFEKATSILNEFKSVFENDSITKIGHHLKYDYQVLKKYGIEVQGKMFDTMIVHGVLYPAPKPIGLKELSKTLLNYQQIEIEQLIGKGKTQKSFREVPMEQAVNYACEDADQTLQLKQVLEKSLLADADLLRVYETIEMPLIKVLAEIEYQGIRLDIDRLASTSKHVSEKMSSLDTTIKQLANTEININSPEQVSILLFEQLGLGPIGQRGKNGFYSVAEKVLEALKDDHEIVSLIREYRKLKKLDSSFLKALPKSVNPNTGKVHTQYNQLVSTGRMSSSKPNLQNIPHHGGVISDEIRKSFIPSDDKHILIAADYAQIELRCMADLSKDATMIAAFTKCEDIHKATAAKVHNVPVDQIKDKDIRRTEAKAINFGLNYGMEAIGLAEKLSQSTGNKVDKAEAQLLMDKYFEQFPDVRKYQQQAIYDATNNGYVVTIFGRKRYLDYINSGIDFKRRSDQRNALNSPIQGTAADIIKLAMVKTFYALKEAGLNTKMVLQVHDELVFDVPIEEKEKAIKIIKQNMESAATLCIPLEVDINSGNNWNEAH